MLKIFLGQKNSVSNIFLGQKNLGQINFLGRKNFWVKNFWLKKIWHKKIFGSEKKFLKKKVGLTQGGGYMTLPQKIVGLKFC